MAEGKMKEKWDHTCSFIAAIFQPHVKKGVKVDPRSFHPYMKSHQSSVQMNVTDLKPILTACGIINDDQVQSPVDLEEKKDERSATDSDDSLDFEQA